MILTADLVICTHIQHVLLPPWGRMSCIHKTIGNELFCVIEFMHPDYSRLIVIAELHFMCHKVIGHRAGCISAQSCRAVTDSVTVTAQLSNTSSPSLHLVSKQPTLRKHHEAGQMC
jgi:hypothetical protein